MRVAQTVFGKECVEPLITMNIVTLEKSLLSNRVTTASKNTLGCEISNKELKTF